MLNNINLQNPHFICVLHKFIPLTLGFVSVSVPNAFVISFKALILLKTKQEEHTVAMNFTTI